MRKIVVMQMPDRELRVLNTIEIGARPQHVYAEIMPHNPTIFQFNGVCNQLKLEGDQKVKLMEFMTRLSYIEDKAALAKTWGIEYQS